MIFLTSVLTPLLASVFLFFLMIRRPPRSTLDRSSAASDVYKRQSVNGIYLSTATDNTITGNTAQGNTTYGIYMGSGAVSYTHLRAHETVLDLVCRLLLEKKKQHTLCASVCVT